MKTRIGILMILAVMILSGQAACQPEQNWLDPNMVPFVTDPNQTNGRLITAIRIEAGPDYEYCFEQAVENHIWPVTINYSGIPAGSRTEGPAFYWQPTFEQVGMWYFTVTATDEPPFYVDSISVTGVWAVQVIPKNPGPVLVPFVR